MAENILDIKKSSLLYFPINSKSQDCTLPAWCDHTVVTLPHFFISTSVELNKKSLSLQYYCKLES